MSTAFISRKEIENKLKKIISEKFCTGAELEQIDKMSEVDMLYLYGEIFMNFDVMLTADDINGNCFSSIEKLSDAIFNAKVEEVRE